MKEAKRLRILQAQKQVKKEKIKKFLSKVLPFSICVVLVLALILTH